VAVGDLVVANYQYEYNGLLMGSLTSYVVEGIEGLWDLPDIRTADQERLDWHGDNPGEDLIAPRRKVITIKAYADTQTQMETNLALLAKTFRQRNNQLPFVWQRPGQAKKFVNARPRRRQFPTSYEMAHGLAAGSVELYCPDPTIYALANSTATVVLASGAAGASTTTATNGGDFEVWPTLTITGAGTNPRISNQQDSNRQVRIDVSMGAGDTLVINTHPNARTATLNGVDRYDLVRNDNQWWMLQSGANTIGFSRTGTAGSQTLTVVWNDGWM
jgi:phage-related protein